MIETVKRITYFCNDIPENQKEISDILDRLKQTEIPYALIPADDPVALMIYFKPSTIGSSSLILAQGRTEVNHYLNLLVEEKKYNPTQ